VIRALPWLLVLALLVGGTLGAVVAYGWRQRLDSEAVARRHADAERLRLADLVVVAERTREDLETRLSKLIQRDAVLDAELARARRAAKLRVVATVEASTAPAPAVGEPRPPEVGEGLCAACLVAPGDSLAIRVGEVVARTEAGNRIVLGSAQLWRLTPAPETRLLAAPWSAPLTEASVVVEPESATWPTWRDGLEIGLGVLAGGALVYLGAVAARD
jgi:hypothetical protein